MLTKETQLYVLLWLLLEMPYFVSSFVPSTDIAQLKSKKFEFLASGPATSTHLHDKRLRGNPCLHIKNSNDVEDFDINPSGDDGDFCLLQDDDCDTIFNSDDPIQDPNGSNTSNDYVMTAKTRIVDNVVLAIPILSPIAAYFTYQEVVIAFKFVSDKISNNNWQAVDGGQFQSLIITPAINGVVLPAVSILFATLIGNTVTTLRQRQLDVRTCLNKEASDIRTLQALIDYFPTRPNEGPESTMDIQDKSRQYLIQYTGRIIAESQPGVLLSNLELGSMDSEMNGFLVQLNEMSQNPDLNNPAITAECYYAVSRLNDCRSTRISALQSTFPALHYFILTVLGASICLSFLMETNQAILIFMNGTQLRILWTILIGTLNALGIVCYDLSDPFQGSYQILTSTDQLFTVREVLRSSDKLKKYKRSQNYCLDKISPLPL